LGLKLSTTRIDNGEYIQDKDRKRDADSAE